MVNSMKDEKKKPQEMIESEAIQVERPREGVVLLTIRSKPLGVLRFGVKRALEEALAELEGDRSARCVVLTGVEKAFSVGSDIKNFSTEIGWLLENDYVEAGLNAAIENSRARLENREGGGECN